MNGVIYARYSSESQREESIEGQLRECRAFAANNGISIIREYTDRAFSARTDKRPDFQRMVKESSQGGYEVVIVWKLDRFARNRYDSAHYKAALKKNGIRVISATENISSDASGILLESMLEGMAEYYSKELAEKVTRGQTENALKCKSNGGSIPLGYTIDENQYYQIDPLMAPAIQAAFQHYADGKTMQQITDEMNLCGIRTVKYGQKLTLNVVSHMLHNRKYIGEYRYRDIVTPGGIPAIISEKLFDQVQERSQYNLHHAAKHKAPEEYLLTTKLFCGKCGSMMDGESGTSKNKETYHYYKCLNAKRKGGCDKRAVRKDWIENLVIEQIKGLLLDDELLQKIAEKAVKKQAGDNTVLPVLESRLKEVSTGLDNLVKALEKGISSAATQRRLEELETEKAELEEQIAKEKLLHPILTQEQIYYWLTQFRKLDTKKTEHRRKLIDVFLNSVYLYDDRLIFTFNYTDDKKTVTRDDISKIDPCSHSADSEHQSKSTALGGAF